MLSDENLRMLMVRALKAARKKGKSREQIASEMGKYLQQPFSKSMLDDLVRTPDFKHQHGKILTPLLLAAFIKATDDTNLAQYIVSERMGKIISASEEKEKVRRVLESALQRLRR